MTTTDYIVLVIILAIIGFAIGYILKAKRSGQKCIGCPNSKSCSGGCCGSSKK
ncbi:MAG: FeoB-associated Cys-rich membrane protein [Clostridia bacterium]|nr:FeoB-associated Cys-rich membrane protein [Clostridia bacterium]